MDSRPRPKPRGERGRGAARPRLGLLRPTRERTLALVWVVGAVVLVLALDAATSHGLGHDAHAYWIVQRSPSAYGGLPGETDAYLYPPLFAQAAQLVTWLPWPVFLALWTGAAVAAYLWLVAPLRWVWSVPILALAVEDVTLGNTTWLLAVLAVAALGRPVWWVAIAFVKPPAAVGLLWPAARREWRALGAAGVVGLGVLSVSYALDPAMWTAYVAWMRHLSEPVALLRISVSALLVVVAARAGRAWLVPVALVVGAPLPLAYTWPYLLAIPRLLTAERLAWLNEPFGGFRAGVRRAVDMP